MLHDVDEKAETVEGETEEDEVMTDNGGSLQCDKQKTCKHLDHTSISVCVHACLCMGAHECVCVCVCA